MTVPQNSITLSPARLIRSAGEKLGKAQLACQSIDPYIAGSASGVEYVLALIEAVRDELIRAQREPRGDATGEQHADQPARSGNVNEPAASPDGLLDAVGETLPSQILVLAEDEALPGVVQDAHNSPSNGGSSEGDASGVGSPPRSEPGGWVCQPA